MEFKILHPPHDLPTSTISNNKIDKAKLENAFNIKLILPVLQELQNNPQAKTLTQTEYPLTFEEYRYLLDILPDLEDLRNIWGRNRIEYLYLFQQLVIMPSAGRRHEAVVFQTARWIMKPIEGCTDKYENNQDNLSQKDRKTWEWYEQLINTGAGSVDLPEVSHSPDAAFGPPNDNPPLVLEVADSQKSTSLPGLAAEYLSLGKGSIKYMFAIDIRDVTADSWDVDLLIWEYIKVEGIHSNKQCELYPLVRADGTQIDTTLTISFPLSRLLGEPPEGCDDLTVVLRISDLIKKITKLLPLKKLAKNNLEKVKLLPGRSITPPRFKEQEKAIQEFNKYDSGSEVDDEQHDPSYQPSSRSC